MNNGFLEGFPVEIISKFFLNRIFLKQRIRQDDSAQRRRTHKVGEGTRRTSMS